MIEMLWWHWALVGFAFVVAELFVPAFVMIWFGMAGFLVMGSMLVIPELTMTMQLLVWTLSSILLLLLWFSVFRRSQHKILIGRASAALEGEIGMIAQPVAPFKTGKVRFQRPLVGSDLWECTSEEEIEAGTRVRVLSVEGNAVVVKRLDNK